MIKSSCLAKQDVSSAHFIECVEQRLLSSNARKKVLINLERNALYSRQLPRSRKEMTVFLRTAFLKFAVDEGDLLIQRLYAKNFLDVVENGATVVCSDRCFREDILSLLFFY